MSIGEDKHTWMYNLKGGKLVPEPALHVSFMISSDRAITSVDIGGLLGSQRGELCLQKDEPDS